MKTVLKSQDPNSPEALKKGLGTMDRILAIIGIFLFLFVVAMVVVFWRFQATPDALIVAVFGLCSFECGAMAAIQRRKTEIIERLKEAKEKNTPEGQEESTYEYPDRTREH